MRLPYIPLIEDPKAPHQITFRVSAGGWLVVSCRCLDRAGQPPIKTAPTVPAREALAAYRAFHQEKPVEHTEPAAGAPGLRGQDPAEPELHHLVHR